MVKRTNKSTPAPAPQPKPAQSKPAPVPAPAPTPAPTPVPAPISTSPADFLAAAVEALRSGTAVYGTVEEFGPLANDPRGALVECNVNMQDPPGSGRFAWRATALGASVHAGEIAAPATPWGGADVGGATTEAEPPAPKAPRKPPSPMPEVSFADAVPIPAIARGGVGRPGYGFDRMAVGSSFFIAQTPDNPNPAKRIASTVSSANERFNSENGYNPPRRFTVRRVDDGAPWGHPGVAGAGVWRIE